MKPRTGRRRWVIPEVVQTSMMDCGPASLKCLLEGFGIPVSYGRLREACQTDVDGTSIDTLEQVAIQLGLDAQQVMVPLDYLLMPEAGMLPGLLVALLPNRVTHFVVIWRRHGRFLQVMDPAMGRSWPTCEHFLSSVYLHTMPVAAAAWREWAGSGNFLTPLMIKLRHLGLRESDASRLLEAACSASGWYPIAALEAATRTTESLVRCGGVKPGSEATIFLDRLFSTARHPDKAKDCVIPDDHWSARPAALSESGEEQVLFKGAVLVQVRGVLKTTSEPEETPAHPSPSALPPELAAALEERPSAPVKEIFKLLRADGILSPLAILVALVLSAAGVMVEAILFRGLLEGASNFSLSGQRLGVMAILLLFLTGLLLLELPIALGLARMGRLLEGRLRMAFLEKLPKLGDRYFHSRLNSDMAERSHSIHRVRVLPDLGGQFLRSLFELVLTTIGVIWMAPRVAPLAVLAAILGVGLPLAIQPLLAERDLRVRNHVGALGRFYLDALLGLVPLRTHRAERALRREHENILVEWAQASLGMQKLVVATEGLQFITGFALAAAILLSEFQHTRESGGLLLLVFWALNIPVLGQDIALLAWQYPSHRNLTLRLLEPLGAKEDTTAATGETVEGTSHRPRTQGAQISFEKVSVHLAGHPVVEDLNLTLEAGSHVAIVGTSGAGKSTLVGTLLGWYRPAAGRLVVDGSVLDAKGRAELRSQTAWVEPGVELWNRSLFDNIRYGSPDGMMPSGDLLETANLHGLIETLPDGLQSRLGEGGTLVSGGEGQRVRLARALLKPGVRLAILDEPFRGLDRRQRHELLCKVQAHWRHATLICVTHDVGETTSFARVLVMEAGRIVQDGTPADLLAAPNSRYRSMLQAENELRQTLWASSGWRHLRLEHGSLQEAAAARK